MRISLSPPPELPKILEEASKEAEKYDQKTAHRIAIRMFIDQDVGRLPTKRRIFEIAVLEGMFPRDKTINTIYNKIFSLAPAVLKSKLLAYELDEYPMHPLEKLKYLPYDDDDSNEVFSELKVIGLTQACQERGLSPTLQNIYHCGVVEEMDCKNDEAERVQEKLFALCSDEQVEQVQREDLSWVIEVKNRRGDCFLANPHDVLYRQR